MLRMRALALVAGLALAGVTGALSSLPAGGAAVQGAAAPGYYEVAADGGIFAYGGATFHGSPGGQPLSSPAVGMAATPGGGGYREVQANGLVSSFGDAAPESTGTSAA